MYMNIMGFLPDEFNDDSLKFDLDIEPDYEGAVMSVLGWRCLEENCQGVFPLSPQQVQDISLKIEKRLPVELELFINVLAS